MPFLEHLEEFRNRVIKSVIAIIIGAIFCLIFSKQLLNVLLWPTTRVDLPIDVHERKDVPRMIGSAPILFLIGVSFAYYLIFPFALEFFLGLAPETIETNIAIDFYISFIIRLLFVFGVIFQLPVMSYFLSRLGILTPVFMRKYRRHAIVVIFILAALFTPPDPFTQVMLGIPLILLYEISIFISQAVHRSKKETQEEVPEEEDL